MEGLITPKNTVFALLSFEGPDRYSTVGGLGIRMTELSRILAEYKYETHFFYIGDPYAQYGIEVVYGCLSLHRWCQWVSADFPGGLYDGEDRKITEWNRSVPDYVVEKIVVPAASDGKLTVIMAEDWHTAESVVLLDKKLREKNLRDYVIILWNVNNEYGFANIDLKAVAAASVVTTVSKFMANRMSKLYGIPAIAIPNGIPKRIINPEPQSKIELLRNCFDGIILEKTARYDRDKAWISAIETVDLLKKRGLKPHLLMRGGAQSHRTDVICSIIEHDLKFVSIKLNNPTFDSILESFCHHSNFDIIEMDFFIPEDFLMYLYSASDAVLANSIYEPFGIVGLEVMAKAGVSILGNTGEDYALNGKNCIRVVSNLPEEVADSVYKVTFDHELRENIKRYGLRTAAAFTWDRALSLVIYRAEKIYVKYIQPKLATENNLLKPYRR